MRSPVNTPLLTKRATKAMTALRTPMFRRALKHGVLAATEHQAVLRSLGNLRLVVDVGANVGQFAIVARQTCPNARIISLEPLARAADRLQLVFAGDPRHQICRIAASDRSGTATMHVSSSDDSSSLLSIGRRQVEEFPETAERATVDVRVARLDELPEVEIPVSDPSLLKIDTQGNELQVLRGAEGVLDNIAHVLVESSFVELYDGQALASDVTRYMSDRGFDLRMVYDVRTSRRTGEPLQADFVFSRVHR